MTAEHTLRPDFHLVVIAQNLERDWNLPEYIDKIERIESVFLFDKNVHVHCCELTPSYELWPVETRVIFKPDFDQDANEELRDEIEEVVRRADEPEVEYHHVGPHDRWMAARPAQVKHLGDTGDGVSYDETSYDDQRREAIEHCQGNHQI